MLSELELKVVNQHKEHGFAAYLQWAWIEYPRLQREIGKGKYPEPSRLSHANKRMDDKRIGFNACYFDSLPRAEVNPLKLEQEAWSLLSPIVKQYLEGFNQYTKGYSPKSAQGEQLLIYLTDGFELLQKWNIISKSFGTKYDIAVYRGTPKFAHIGDEGWFKNIPEKEKAVSELIKELSSKLHDC